MIYTPQTKKAMTLCYLAHRDQTDKGGLPYVFHPFHLAEQMQDENTTITALLHDVVEDTEYTLNDLERMGFGDEVITALALLTHKESEPYLDYIWRIRENPIARAVKQADLCHNCDLSRLDHVTDKDKSRIIKYKIARTILKEHRKEYDGTYRVIMPLDNEKLYFLSMFYRETGADHYSLDAEYANDVHYEFSAKDVERIRKLLPEAESLPEALAAYLIENNEENFAALLLKNHIRVEGFHF